MTDATQTAVQKPSLMQTATPSAANTSTPSVSTLISRNITVDNHRTSVRLEPEMWNGFAEICRRERQSMHQICTLIAQEKPEASSLTAAIRVFVMAYYRAAATEDGHIRAGHGPGGQMMTNLILKNGSVRR